MERPNFLFISTHDINPHLGCYQGIWPGAGQVATPHLDALAAEGVRFDQAMSAAPVCAPSRAAIFTGRYPTSIGTMHMRSNALPPDDVELFPQALRRAGYYTTNNWFTDVNMDVPATVFDDCTVRAHWRDRPDPDMPFFAAFHGLATHESQIHAEGDRLESFLAAVPHDERISPEDVQLPPYHPDTPVFRKIWANYLNLIAAMDAWVGGLLAELEADGLAENTVVIFWSDHGAGFPGAKRWAAEAGVRVPLIMRWPGRIAAGTTRHDVVETQDLAATVLNLAGVEPKGKLDSRPLVDPEGGMLGAREFAFSARDRMVDDRDTSRTVRSERFRYVRHLHPDRPWMQYSHFPDRYPTWQELRRLRYEEAGQEGDGRNPDLLSPAQRRLTAASKDPEELYDVLRDPHQTTNLIDDPELASVRAELREALDDWLQRTGDLGLLPEEQLLERWSPGGVRATAETPRVSVIDGSVTAHVRDPATSIGWTRKEPGDRGALPMERGLGRMQFPHPWELYASPVPTGDGPIWVRSWRLGLEPSEIVRVG